MLRRLLLAFGIAGIVLVAMLFSGGPSAHPVPKSLSTVLLDVERGHGSGVHIGGGLFLTAAHVAEDARDGKLTIETSDGDRVAGQVLWLNSQYDVALVQAITSTTAATARMDCSAAGPRPGDRVEVIGNPLNLRFIHTWGRVSAGVSDYNKPRSAFIADITIAPGNSGGPMFNARGRLVGIVVAMANAPTGIMTSSLLPISYIVPMSAVCTLLGRAS